MYRDPPHFEIVIAGAGFSGLGLAMSLKKAGIEDLVVLERADDLGGTWRDNTYPGCACDIPSVLYSWTDDQNPRWSRAFSGQQEIWDYMREVVDRHDIADHLRFGHEVLELRWDDEHGLWHIETSEGPFTADVAIGAVGALADPSIPNLPGLDTFEGKTFHSARWDHDYDLNDKNVAVVGTGASASQFVPEIQPRVNKLHVFPRTPPWVLPRTEGNVPERWKRRFERHPRLLHAVRRAVFSLQEATHVMFKHPRLTAVAEFLAKRMISQQVADPALRAKVTPNYRLGCKRILGSNTWYPAITADNVDVVTAGIKEVTPTGIIDADGVEHRADTIIFGTGFLVTDPPISYRVTGRTGETLAETWDGSPKAHLGMSVAGFPNFFLLLGPNTGLGHNSVLVMIEAQVDYLMQALAYRRSQALQSIEPRPEVQARFIDEVERGTEGSVWTAGGCASWYTDATGRNSTLWPGTVRAYQRRLRTFEPADYRVELPAPARVAATVAEQVPA